MTKIRIILAAILEWLNARDPEHVHVTIDRYRLDGEWRCSSCHAYPPAKSEREAQFLASRKAALAALTLHNDREV